MQPRTKLRAPPEERPTTYTCTGSIFRAIRPKKDLSEVDHICRMLACVGTGIVIPAASGRIGRGIIADGGHGHHQAICIGHPFEIPELFELIIGLIAPVQYHDEAMLPIGQSTIGRENPCRVPRDYILRGRVPTANAAWEVKKTAVKMRSHASFAR